MALLRDMTDRAVLDRVFADGRATRAELASQTGISKPTISESVRRLEAAGLLRATGSDQTGRRGRIATVYQLAPEAGYVLAVQVNQHGVHALAATLTGTTLDQRQHRAARPGDPDALADALRDTVRAVAAASVGHGSPRAVAVSVANPVDPITREVIALPESPFPEGRIPVAEIVSRALVDGRLADGAALRQVPLLVDNDVNFSALAERRAGAASGVESFVYVYLGAGLGMSLYLGEQLVRGAHGLAGEIGYLDAAPRVGRVAGPPTRLAVALAARGFGRPDSPALDVEAILATLDRASTGDPRAAEAVAELAEAIAGAVAATCTIVDPDVVLLGGPLGTHPGLLEPIRASVARTALASVRIQPGALTDAASLRGALLSALDTARKVIAVLVSGGTDSDLPDT